MKRPLISIITVVYNACSTLESAIKSVISQENGLYELLIIDGGSTDGTTDILEKYKSNISLVISEPDKGIYDAMNKGVASAIGEWLYFLGADDKLSEGVLAKISDKLNSKFAVVYGDVVYDTGQKIHSRLGYRILLENTLHHQGAFYNQNLFTDFRYDNKYRVSSDYELNLRVYLEKLPTVYIPHIIAVCGSMGVSSITSSQETNRIRGKYVKKPIINSLLSVMLTTYYKYFNMKKSIKHRLKHIFMIF